MISDVYLFRNGMVMVFDWAGQQMPDHQGRIVEVGEKLLADATEETRWHVGNWGHGVRRIGKLEFQRLAREIGESSAPLYREEKNHAGRV